MEIKVVCVCGQKYKFDVEPVNGVMPWIVKCPVCTADGTATANVLIAQQLAAAPPRPAAPFAALPRPVAVAAPAAPVAVAAPPPVPVGAPAPVAMTAPVSPEAAQPRTPFRPAPPGRANKEDHDTWKWWYYVLAGVCFAGYDVWYALDTHKYGKLGGLFLSVVLIFVGFWKRSADKAKA